MVQLDLDFISCGSTGQAWNVPAINVDFPVKKLMVNNWQCLRFEVFTAGLLNFTFSGIGSRVVGKIVSHVSKDLIASNFVVKQCKRSSFETVRALVQKTHT
jgi:hypothetical protein